MRLFQNLPGMFFYSYQVVPTADIQAYTDACPHNKSFAKSLLVAFTIWIILDLTVNYYFWRVICT